MNPKEGWAKKILRVAPLSLILLAAACQAADQKQPTCEDLQLTHFTPAYQTFGGNGAGYIQARVEGGIRDQNKISASASKPRTNIGPENPIIPGDGIVPFRVDVLGNQVDTEAEDEITVAATCGDVIRKIKFNVAADILDPVVELDANYARGQINVCTRVDDIRPSDSGVLEINEPMSKTATRPISGLSRGDKQCISLPAKTIGAWKMSFEGSDSQGRSTAAETAVLVAPFDQINIDAIKIAGKTFVSGSLGLDSGNVVSNTLKIEGRQTAWWMPFNLPFAISGKLNCTDPNIDRNLSFAAVCTPITPFGKDVMVKISVSDPYGNQFISSTQRIKMPKAPMENQIRLISSIVGALTAAGWCFATARRLFENEEILDYAQRMAMTQNDGYKHFIQAVGIIDQELRGKKNKQRREKLAEKLRKSTRQFRFKEFDQQLGDVRQRKHIQEKGNGLKESMQQLVECCQISTEQECKTDPRFKEAAAHWRQAFDEAAGYSLNHEALLRNIPQFDKFAYDFLVSERVVDDKTRSRFLMVVSQTDIMDIFRKAAIEYGIRFGGIPDQVRKKLNLSVDEMVGLTERLAKDSQLRSRAIQIFNQDTDTHYRLRVIPTLCHAGLSDIVFDWLEHNQGDNIRQLGLNEVINSLGAAISAEQFGRIAEISHGLGERKIEIVQLLALNGNNDYALRLLFAGFDWTLDRANQIQLVVNFGLGLATDYIQSFSDSGRPNPNIEEINQWLNRRCGSLGIEIYEHNFALGQVLANRIQMQVIAHNAK